MLVIGVAPMLAPTAGAAIAAAWGWRAVFVVLAVMGTVLAWFVYRRLPDTLGHPHRRPPSPLQVARGYRGLARDRRFVFLALLPGLGQSALMAWVVASPFLVMETYALAPALFPVVFAAGGLCMVGGAQLNAGLVRRFGPRRLLGVALPAALAGALVLVALSVARVGGLAGLLAPLFVVLVLTGLGPANASALAMSRHGEAAGSAAALIGSIQAGTAGGMTALLGWVGGGQLGLALVMAGVLALALAIAATGAGVYRPEPPRLP
jgi:DHA1 family bicyclomycin/chloramphenicol resistance-like MFS transporter